MKKTRLQIVDDHPAIHVALSHIMDAAQYHLAASAYCATEAVAQYKTIPIDAVVLDLSLPRHKGETVIDFHRRNKTNVPILIFTGYCDASRLRQCMKKVLLVWF
ncbi:MAG: response regulator transcription factor [Blastochloris sp.]|nr:response regulator transcription factor [Blastochloris sp.]